MPRRAAVSRGYELRTVQTLILLYRTLCCRIVLHEIDPTGGDKTNGKSNTKARTHNKQFCHTEFINLCGSTLVRRQLFSWKEGTEILSFHAGASRLLRASLFPPRLVLDGIMGLNWALFVSIQRPRQPASGLSGRWVRRTEIAEKELLLLRISAKESQNCVFRARRRRI